MLEKDILHTVIADTLSQEAIVKQLETSWAGQQVVFYDTVKSTNDVAKELANDDSCHGALVVAEQQLSGRGRMGRLFSSPKGVGIWMSLVIEDEIEPTNASMLTLVMGLAAAKAVHTVTGLRPQIKWPNDLILNGKKLVGILTEMTLKADGTHPIILGVGINVNNEDFPEEIQSVATSVFLESGTNICRAQLLAEVLKQFESYYHVFMQTQDMSRLMDEYNECLINRDRQVKVQDPKGSYMGQAVGINAAGELLVKTEHEVRRVASGEVSVRGVLGYV